MTKPTLPGLIADARRDGGGSVGLLAYEIAKRDARGDRSRGPLDGACEVCGAAADSFLLYDWIRWHCPACSDAAFRAEAGLPSAKPGKPEPLISLADARLLMAVHRAERRRAAAKAKKGGPA